MVEASRRWKRTLVVDTRTWLKLPDHLEFLAKRVVLDRSQRHQVLHRRECGFKRAACERALRHVGDQIASVTNLDDLTLLGWDGNGHQHTPSLDGTYP